jgi:acyl-CoA hydrolase
MSIMNWKEDYAKKCVTAQEAAAAIQSGDKIILLPVNSMPIDILNALAARKDDLQKVKIASNLMTYPFAFVQGDYAGHITYYSGYFGPLERMFFAQGNVVPYPMHLSKSSIALDRSGYSDVALLEVTPPDSRGYMNLGPCGAVYGRFAIDKC